MLAEMGDYSFRLGHLDHDAYEDMLGGELLFRALEDSLAESSPMCSECPFLPHCGSDPVFHKATHGDVVGHKAFSAFCAKQTGILQHLIRLLEDDPRARRILLGWL
jgi:sulfatase maturation enzyme AslB (radical SAM superfamily)